MLRHTFSFHDAKGLAVALAAFVSVMPPLLAAPALRGASGAADAE